MDWLLKIVDGPMKGAEIALVSGFRAKVGSSDACDVVLADTALAEQAFELDVSDDAVTLIGPDGEAKAVTPLTIFRFGSSAFAVGAADGPWGELKEPGGDAVPDKDDSSSGEAGGEATAPSLPGEGGPEADAKSPPETGGEETAAPSKPGKGRFRPSLPGGARLFARCCAIGSVLLLAILVWLLWPRIASACPALETARLWVRDRFVTPPPPPAQPPLTLAEIAAQHGLSLGERNGRPLIVGNVARRTERQAIRALALATDPMTDFDLTDDESLKASATDLLFVVTEGDLYATAASNRVVTLAGYAPDAKRFESAIRALNADVPGIARLVTSAVQIGGERPRRVDATGAPVSRDVPAAASAKKSLVTKDGVLPLPASRAYAIAGILTKPYPCLVMRNGMRLVEGAEVDGAVIEKIEVDRLTLKEGKVRFEWKP